MLNTKRMEAAIGAMLLGGTLLSAGLVALGGILYLLRYGNQPIQSELNRSAAYAMTPESVQTLASFSAVNLIELGLLCLVATQVLRVMLLVGFYAYLRDRWFTSISLFILVVLLVSNA